MKKEIKIIILLAMTPLIYILLHYLIPETGAIYTHDSVAYTYGAKALVEGRGMVYFGYKTPIMQWPPLYVLLMTIPTILDISPAIFIQALNPLIYVVLIIIMAGWIYRYMHHKWMMYMSLLFIAFGIPMVHVMRYIWTEPIFLLVLVMAIMAFHRYLQESSTKWLVIAGLLSSLCWLTRYMGVTLLMTCCIYMLLRRQAIGKKLKNLLLYGTISAFPMLLWVIRNYMYSQTFTGSRGMNKIPLMKNVLLSLRLMCSWFISTHNLVALLGFGLLVIMLIYLFLRSKREKKSVFGNHGRIITLLLLYIGLYMTILLFMASNYAMDPMNNRMLLPIYIPGVWLLLAMLDGLLDGSRSYMGSSARGILTACVALGILLINFYPISYHLNGLDNFHRAKEGYEFYGESNEMIPYIKALELGSSDVIITNNPTLLTYKTGVDCRWTPKKKSIYLYEYEAIMGAMKGKNMYVVWFGPPSNLVFYTVEELKEKHELRLIKSFREGSIYRIES